MTPKRLRILHLNSAFKWTGEAAHSVDLCRGMQRRGHDVLWVGARGLSPVEHAAAEGLETRELRLKSRFGWWREIGDVRALRAIVTHFRPDLIHCHRGKDHLLAVLALRWWGRRLHVPLVRTRHVVMPVDQHPGNRYLYGRATDFLLAVSRPTAGSLGPLWPGGERGLEEAWHYFVEHQLVNPAASFERGNRRAAIVLSAADLDVFSPGRREPEWRRTEMGLPENALAVGLVGRLQRIKGQKVFLKAARLLAERLPDVHFICAGRGNPVRLENLAREGHESPLGHRWHVLGPVEDVAQTIACLDVGVVASLGSEGSSRITFEYLASGLPVVASRVGGIPDVKEAFPGVDLNLVEPGNPEALADAIAAAVEQVRAGRKQGYPDEVRLKLGQERWLDNIEQVYFALVR